MLGSQAGGRGTGLGCSGTETRPWTSPGRGRACRPASSVLRASASPPVNGHASSQHYLGSFQGGSGAAILNLFLLSPSSFPLFLRLLPRMLSGPSPAGWDRRLPGRRPLSAPPVSRGWEESVGRGLGRQQRGAGGCPSPHPRPGVWRGPLPLTSVSTDDPGRPPARHLGRALTCASGHANHGKREVNDEFRGLLVFVFSGVY